MKFHSKAVEEHSESPLPDAGQWERLINYWNKREKGASTTDVEGNRCYVISVESFGSKEAGKLDEIVRLVKAQGDQVVGSETRELRNKIEPRTYIGKGMSEGIARQARSENADLLVFDVELSPSQMRNLEDLTGFPIIDREGVILNVFHKHARTKSAKIQVEIAHLEYLRPRIRGIGLNMDQQAGGIIGSRGAGETASELMARRLDHRLSELRKGFSKLKKQKSDQRKQRKSSHRIALVGYTNAGKTSLMNVLSSAEGSVRDMLFETLDTTTRCLSRHGGDVLLSDTVGFIRNLPKRLFSSFESTLSEISEASLLAIVIDLSDPMWELHLKTTEEVLQKINADSVKRIYVFNKMDKLKEIPENLHEKTQGHRFTTLSAHVPKQVQKLKSELLSLVREEEKKQELFIPYVAGKAMSLLYTNCRVIEAEPTPKGMNFTVEGSSRALNQIQQLIKEVAE